MSEEETAVIIEKEIENLDSFKNSIVSFFLNNCYHVNRCQRTDCINCKFINELSSIYNVNVFDEKKGIACFQNYCRQYLVPSFS